MNISVGDIPVVMCRVKRSGTEHPDKASQICQSGETKSVYGGDIFHPTFRLGLCLVGWVHSRESGPMLIPSKLTNSLTMQCYTDHI